MTESRRPVGRPPSITATSVLDAAVTVIARSGIEGCTLRAVADELGVTAMALYRHVESKDDLLTRVPDHLVGAMAEAFSADDSSGVESLRRVAAALAELLRANPAIVPLFARPMMGPNMTSIGATCVERLVAEGVDQARAGGLLRATVALVVGLAASGGDSAEERLGPIVDDAVEIWLAGVEQRA